MVTSITAFAATGTLNLKNADFARDKNPVEQGCACPACQEYTRGYIRHLIKAEEITPHTPKRDLPTDYGWWTFIVGAIVCGIGWIVWRRRRQA